MSQSSDIQITTIYSQIRQGNDPCAVLGLETRSLSELKTAYRNLALLLHPDKCPLHLRGLHTTLFQKVQDAYDQLTKDIAGFDTPSPVPVRYIPETLEQLHARNLAFKEALCAERKQALIAKKTEDAQKAARVLKNERLAEKRGLRRAEAGVKARDQAEECQKRAAERIKGFAKTAEKTGKDLQSIENWEEEEDRLSAAQAVSGRKARRGKSRLSKAKQDKPTSAHATPIYELGLDGPVASYANINHRWHKPLLSGGRSGSVSLIERRRKEETVQAGPTEILRVQEAYLDALTHGKPFSPMVHEELLDAVYEEESAGLDAKMDRRMARLGDYMHLADDVADPMMIKHS